jgi:hypothetical protein
MEQEFLSQTALDQMVGDDRTQFLKATIPYLSPQGQQILAIYAKANELKNTISAFSRHTPGAQIQAASAASAEPLDAINDIRRFCYGESRQKLDQLANIMAAISMVQMMSENETENDAESQEESI